MRDRRPDTGTRKRLVETAVRLFAQRGFRSVTVREICRQAGANVAAVNYHFGGKMGLYSRVQELAIEAMRQADESARREGGNGSAEQRLRAYILVHLRHLQGEGTDRWLHRLIAHELTDPTSALDVIVSRAVRPRLEFLSLLVGGLMGLPPTDDEVRDCAASIQAQCLMALPGAVANWLRPGRPRRPADIARLAAHISAFSLAAIRGMRHAGRRRRALPARRRRQERS